MISILLAAVLFAAFDNLDLGVPGDCDQVVNRSGCALGYSEAHEQPLWVTYRLTADEVTNTVVSRSGWFYPDSEILVPLINPNPHEGIGALGRLILLGEMPVRT